VPLCPDFLRRLVALIHFMRLSLMKSAHADLSSTAWQEIGVTPSFAYPGVPWGLSGMSQLNPPQFQYHRFAISMVLSSPLRSMSLL
jgi:hypothetical protein